MPRPNLASIKLAIATAFATLPANDEGSLIAQTGLDAPLYNDGAKWIMLGGGGQDLGATPVGRYVGPFANTSSGTVITAGRNTVAPFYVPRRMSFDRAAVFVNAVVASSLLRGCLYADNGDFYPGALLLDMGTSFDCNVLNLRENTISLSLDPGVYWIGARASGAPNVRSVNGDENDMGKCGGGDNTFTGSVITAYYTSPASVFPALPNPFEAGASVSGSCPAARLRRSA